MGRNLEKRVIFSHLSSSYIYIRINNCMIRRLENGKSIQRSRENGSVSALIRNGVNKKLIV